MGETTYGDLRAELEEALGCLSALAEERGSDEAAEAAGALARKLAEGRFEVFVVGEFKRGKSTFVNALLGREVLPTGVLPLTSVATAVAWGGRARAEVAFGDGRVEPVPFDRLWEFVTEAGNPENRRGVDRAVVYWPADLLRDGVLLWDTPGTGSVYRHNTEAARAALRRADAAVLLLCADPPISEREQDLLASDLRALPRLFVVLNKVDHVPGPEREQALSFTRQVVSRSLGAPAPVYPVSARLGLQARLAGDQVALAASGLPALERDLRRFLLADRGRALLLSVAVRARALVADELNSLHVERAALSLPPAELHRRAEEMERALEEVRRARDDLRVLLEEEVRRLTARLEADLAAFRSRATPALLEEAEAFVAGREDLGGARSDLEALVRGRLRERVEAWRREEERALDDASRRVAARLADQANALIARAVSLCAQVLEVELSPVPAAPLVAAESRFTFAPLDPPTILESLLPDPGRILPRPLARRRLLRYLREHVPLLVDKHAGRLRWDFVQRLQTATRALHHELDDRLEATVRSLGAGVHRALEEGARTAESARRALERAAAQAARLEDLDRALGRIAARAREPEDPP
jgi:GTPase SAR1 family protein